MSYLQTIDFCRSSVCSPGERRTLTRLARHRADHEMIGSEAQQLVDAGCNPHTNSLIWASKAFPRGFTTCLSFKTTFEWPCRRSHCISTALSTLPPWMYAVLGWRRTTWPFLTCNTLCLEIKSKQNKHKHKHSMCGNRSFSCARYIIANASKNCVVSMLCRRETPKSKRTILVSPA